MIPELRTKTRMILVIALIIVMIVSLAFMIGNITEAKAYDRYMEAAQISTLNGDYDSALASLRKAEAAERTDECLLMIAQCYEAKGNYDKAIEALRSINSTDQAIFSKVAAIEAKKKTTEEAGLVTIAGMTYSDSLTSLKLDNTGLSNEALNDIVKLYSLSSLSLRGNDFSDISALSSLGGLTALDISNNRVTDLSPLSALTSLRTLNIEYDPVKDLTPLYSLVNLTSLNVLGSGVSQEEIDAFSQALPNCAVTGFSSPDSESMIAIGGKSFSVSVSNLDLKNTGISDISALSACKNLVTLNLSDNKISDLTPLMDLPKLQYLYVSGNMISDLRPLMGIAELKGLDASGNIVSSTVALGSVTSLIDLNLSGNPITNFTGLSKLRSLTSLDISLTGLTDNDVEAFSNLSKLVSLNVEGNSSLTGGGYDKLKELLPGCNIAHSELVYSVEVNGREVTTDTTDLNLSGCGISDLQFIMQLKFLQSADLSCNALENVYYLQHTDSWKTLTSLDLSENSISDLTPISSLRNLTKLDLSDNRITDITPLYALQNLKELDLAGNTVPEDQLANLRAALYECVIYS